ncbi:MAG: pyruvate:ferredoxin (flavodoxin) oxidoreductase, partial [Flavobacteriaceae bacterium]|nr:pyruvate:ferredoxin (flavodoxin) oxidoreductase [Flavobacteriaceae bacterium]
MKASNKIIVDANSAVANMAYRTNEVFPIYPITPATEMSELVEKWNASGVKNIFGDNTVVRQLQSEAGVAGTLHGALQTGSLSTTFTSSQGLLLMIPNMYRIAAELFPNVIHVATRSIAAQALSIFGDHTDIMAARTTGYAFLGSSTVQEAYDMALIAQAATLESRIPIIHFFDGFRTSHEVNCLEEISDEIILKMISNENIWSHRNRGLSNSSPSIRGSAQGPELYFQSREAVNTYYAKASSIFRDIFVNFENLTGRPYRSLEYYGHERAEHLIISMGSSISTIKETIDLYPENKWGCINIRVFRPFDVYELGKILPETVKTISVLDRTKECGAIGEPLFVDVSSAILKLFSEEKITKAPKVIGGRYGLSSKEFTPEMAVGVFQNAESSDSQSPFTVGIVDDVTHYSLPYSLNKFKTRIYDYEIIIKDKNQTLVKDFSGLCSGLGEGQFVQGYPELSYSKFNPSKTFNVRLNKEPINSSYKISKADLVICVDSKGLENLDIISRIKRNGVILILSEVDKLTIQEEAYNYLIQNEISVIFSSDYSAEKSSLKSLANLINQVRKLHITSTFEDKNLSHLGLKKLNIAENM